MSGDVARAIEFVRHEAGLLDTGELRPWLELWDEEVTYWIPAARDPQGPRLSLNVIYDDRRRLTQRIDRLAGESAHTQAPRSTVRRILGWPQVEPRAGLQACAWVGSTGADRELCILSAPFVLVAQRRGVQQVFSGSFEYALATAGGGLRMRGKRVDVDGIDEPMGNISFIW